MPDCDSTTTAKRSYPVSEVGGLAERRYPASEVRGNEERSYPSSKFRGSGWEGRRYSMPLSPRLEVAGRRSYLRPLSPRPGAMARRRNPHAQGQGRWPGGPTPRPRSGGCAGARGPRGAIPH